ncbi:hypothetical protein POX_b03044 [Penicillium oxalicum]|uniref:hypothetical protein n=1 Tax=Penicillium oxalicum TaxID=69781 RepID=UPI0020B75D22|nr:hypothetical protein POX_b03044 [Penicillium oxalicum]KAI2792998.1 hypothetical protein POX_b03044 [Penicillium oxalicum]
MIWTGKSLAQDVGAFDHLGGAVVHHIDGMDYAQSISPGLFIHDARDVDETSLATSHAPITATATQITSVIVSIEPTGGTTSKVPAIPTEVTRVTIPVPSSESSETPGTPTETTRIPSSISSTDSGKTTSLPTEVTHVPVPVPSRKSSDVPVNPTEVTRVTISVGPSQTSHGGSSTMAVVTRVTFSILPGGTSKVYVTETLTEMEPCSESTTEPVNPPPTASVPVSIPAPGTVTETETETLPCSHLCSSTGQVTFTVIPIVSPTKSTPRSTSSSTTGGLTFTIIPIGTHPGSAPVTSMAETEIHVSSSLENPITQIATESQVETGSCGTSTLCTSWKTTSICVTSAVTLTHTMVGGKASLESGSSLMTSGATTLIGAPTASAGPEQSSIGVSGSGHQPIGAGTTAIALPTTEPPSFSAGDQLDISKKLTITSLLLLACAFVL